MMVNEEERQTRPEEIEREETADSSDTENRLRTSCKFIK